MIHTLKYKQIAASNPSIHTQTEKIKSNWNEWVLIVGRSGIYKKYTNMGYKKSIDDCAKDIYTIAVWSLGVLRLLPASDDLQKTILNFYHQVGLKVSSKSIPMISGLPHEIYFLDVWLEGIFSSYYSVHQNW